MYRNLLIIGDDGLEEFIPGYGEYIDPDLIDIDGISSNLSHNLLLNRDLSNQHPISAITDLSTTLSGKQATLVSGINIKTINTLSLLGSGNIDISGSGITDHDDLTGRDSANQHPISAITDLSTTLSGKQAVLVSGTNIKTINGESLLGPGNITIEASSILSSWATSTLYSVGQEVLHMNLRFLCKTEHTSSSFSTDLQYWESTISNAKIVNQNSHGFSLLQPIYHYSGSWLSAKADNENTLSDPPTIVAALNTNYFLAVWDDTVIITSHGLTVDEVYILSQTVSGGLSLTEVTAGYHNPILKVIDANTLHILNFRPVFLTDNSDQYWIDDPYDPYDTSITSNYKIKVQIAEVDDSPDENNVGMLRYREDVNNSYIDMCMKTGSSTYTWVNIKTNTW